MSSTEEINWSNGPVQDGQQGLVVMPYSEKEALSTVMNQLNTKTEPEPDDDTPDPASNGDRQRSGGVIRRVNDFRSTLGSVALESIALQGPEISKTIRKRQEEMYRNEFPILVPAFQKKCRECGTEHDENVEECEVCDSEGLRDADIVQKRNAERFFRSVNKEDQSLRQLYKYLEGDHSRLGVALHVIRKEYDVSPVTFTFGDNNVVQRGQVVNEEVKELVRGDPKRIKPVVDENGRIGDYWWTCPVHREESISQSEGTCDHCGCALREVYFAETDGPHSKKPEKFYFNDEVVTWAFFNTRLNGLDGMSEVIHLWLKQAILQWMDIYAAGFYDSDNKKYPGKMMVVHTTNAKAFEKALDEAKADAEDSAYAQGVVYNEYGVESNSTPEAQVIDMMSDEILGQSESIRKEFKTDIRTAYGVTDVFDSELDDAGGLNNEGLQLEVTDRSIASGHHDQMDGPLDKLMRVLGYDEWKVRFVPPQTEEEEMTLQEKADTLLTLKQANVDFSVEDGNIEIHGAGEAGPAIDERGQPTDEEPGKGVEEGNGSPSDSEIEEGLEVLEKGFKHIAWDGPQNQEKARTPFFNDDQDVPDFAREKIEEALEKGGLSPTYERISNTRVNDVHRFFEEKFTQPQGWSLVSLVDDFTSRFDVEQGYAKTVIIDQTTSLFNFARELGYREREGLEEDRFKWKGPQDASTTECCEYIKRETADGVTLDRLREIVQEAHKRFYPEHPDRKWIPHYSCRHTFVEEIPS